MKRQKLLLHSDVDLTVPLTDYLSLLSLEVLCKILDYLPIRDILRIEHLCKCLHSAVSMHLRLVRAVDLSEIGSSSEVCRWLPSHFSDDAMASIVSRCPLLELLHGFHPRKDQLVHLLVNGKLSVQGIVNSLQKAVHLLGVETSSVKLLEALLVHLPAVQILGPFHNRFGSFPPCERLSLRVNPHITHLLLTGVSIQCLPQMDYVRHIQLRWVAITSDTPFGGFAAPRLRTFVMSNCGVRTSALKYIPLATSLAAALSLTRLELVRVPFLGGLIQHMVQDSWQVMGFRSLQKVVFGACKHVLEIDLGCLVISCSARIEELAIQPSLTKDSFFASLSLANVDFPCLEILSLGYVDDFPPKDVEVQQSLTTHGLLEVTELPANISDVGLRTVGHLFQQLKCLTVYNCPQLNLLSSWIVTGVNSWCNLRELNLRRCHSVSLSDFCVALSMFPLLEILRLEEMFRQPPKGCSRVGLSAGTGLGVSSALVATTGVHLSANQNATNNIAANNNNVPANHNAADNDVVPANQNANLNVLGNNNIPNNNVTANVSNNLENVNNSAVQNVDNMIPTTICNGGPGKVLNNQPDSCHNTSADQACSSSTPLEIPTCGNSDLQEVGISCVNSRVQCETSCTVDNELQSACTSSSCDNCQSRCHKQSPCASDRGGRSSSPCALHCMHCSSQATLCSSASSCVSYSTDNIDRLPCSCCNADNCATRPCTKKNCAVVISETDSALECCLSKHCSNCCVHSLCSVSQSCQAVSTEIREQTKNAPDNIVFVTNCDKDFLNTEPGNTVRRVRRSHNQLATLQVDESTSTSDPVLEEDHVQVLYLSSESLLSVCLSSVGITSLVVKNGPNIENVSAHGCSSLRTVVVHGASHLHSLSLTECQKLNYEDVFMSVCSKRLQRNCFVFIQPTSACDLTSVQKKLMNSVDQQCHTAVINDYDTNIVHVTSRRTVAALWPNFVSKLTRLYNTEWKQDEQSLTSTAQCEMQNIYTLQGISQSSVVWELTSDLPWIKSLSSLTDADEFFNPSHVSCLSPDELKQTLLADSTETSRSLFSSSIVFHCALGLSSVAVR